MADRLDRYFELLGLTPGVSKDEINTTYYMLIEKFPKNPTEEEEAQLQEVKHAFTILQRNYTATEPKRRIGFKPRTMLPILGTLVLVLGITFVVMNYQDIRLMVVEYQPGDVVRFKDKDVSFGTLLRYDPEHQFHTGPPTPAYEIRLADKEETIWLSDRIVIKGMIVVDQGGPRAAAVGGSSR